MSPQPARALVSQPELQKEIPELTDAYRKAHKSYVLASGLLASWELIGITLQTKEKWGIELKSPTAVPLILFVLVIYSGYKTSIEWWQCNPERKQHPAAKWDYRVAHGIAFIAIVISIVQALLHIQILDVLARHTFIYRIILLVIIAPLIIVALFGKNTTARKRAPLTATVAALSAILIVLQRFAKQQYWDLLTPAILVAAAIWLGLQYYRDRRAKSPVNSRS